MSEPIKVGDLVVLVRGHSCAVNLIGGIPFTVTELIPQSGGGWSCGVCGACDLAPEADYGASGVPKVNADIRYHRSSPVGGMPITWLKRIPPLTDDEREDWKLELEEVERFSRLIKDNA